ncbi:MAG: hypothetical protein M1385_00530 [Candidatus Marsarchaeota archaeon]|nr:hypothetical protein [Candidatus Marsarchaeota archaeon]
MPAHVYICERSDIDALKKMLAYDPYLDPNIIPHRRDDDPKKMNEEDKKRVLDEDKRISENLAKLKSDVFFDVIFARQEYEILDGVTLNLEKEKYYLYLKANDDFLNKADKKLEKYFSNIKRADKSTEERVIAFIEDRNNKAEAGFGSIFGV